MTGRYLVLVLGFLFSASARSGVVDTPKLRNDPFARPDLSAKPSTANAKNIKESGSAWNPVLLSTLRADDSSMVNVDGRILMLGENIDGYTLIGVKERSAIFENAGNRYTLEIDARANDEANR